MTLVTYSDQQSCYMVDSALSLHNLTAAYQQGLALIRQGAQPVFSFSDISDKAVAPSGAMVLLWQHHSQGSPTCDFKLKYDERLLKWAQLYGLEDAWQGMWAD